MELFPLLDQDVARLEVAAAPPAPERVEVEERGLLSCSRCGLSSYIGRRVELERRASSGRCPSCLAGPDSLSVRGVVAGEESPP